MKSLSLVLVLLLAGCSGLKTKPDVPVCTIVHKQVVMLPLVCHNHEMCDKPAVVEICDQVQIGSKVDPQ